MKRPKSYTGLVILAAYLLLACILFSKALTCQGFACDFVALPAVFPLGFPLAWLFAWIDHLFVLPDLTGGLLRKWHFILPTVLANALFYYWAGVFFEKLLSRQRRRSAGHN